MAGRITIDAAVLDAHARHVEQVAADVRTAIQAANQTMISSGAFGLMCSWMVPPFLATASLSTSTLGSVASALDRSARELRGVGGDFEDYERQVSAKLSRESAAVDAV